MKRTINIMHVSHPETTPHFIHGKIVFHEIIPGAKNSPGVCNELALHIKWSKYCNFSKALPTQILNLALEDVGQ